MPTRITAVLAAALLGAIPASAQRHELGKVLAPDGTTGDQFGRAVALSGRTLLVGARNDDDNGSGGGSAYLFDISDPDSPALIAKLVPDDAGYAEHFGDVVAISPGLAAVGVPEHSFDHGGVYLYDAATGEKHAKLRPDGDSWGERFGWAVAIDGPRLLVGAPGDWLDSEMIGSAYLFDVSDPATPVRLLRLRPDDRDEPSRRFGSSVGLGAGILAVGAEGNDSTGKTRGSVHLIDAATGATITQIVPADGAPGDHFGATLAISGHLLAVGAPHDEDRGYFAGAIYVFNIADPALPVQLYKLLPEGPSIYDRLGASLAVDGGTLIAGVENDGDGGYHSGAAYLHEMATGALIAKLVPSDGADWSYFGCAAAISGETAVVGAYGDRDNGSSSGAAYVFDAAPCPPDLTGDGTLDTIDFLVFLIRWSDRDPQADWNSDGTIDTRDFIAFLADWAAGC